MDSHDWATTANYHWTANTPTDNSYWWMHLPVHAHYQLQRHSPEISTVRLPQWIQLGLLRLWHEVPSLWLAFGMSCWPHSQWIWNIKQSTESMHSHLPVPILCPYVQTFERSTWRCDAVVLRKWDILSTRWKGHNRTTIDLTICSIHNVDSTLPHRNLFIYLHRFGIIIFVFNTLFQ